MEDGQRFLLIMMQAGQMSWYQLWQGFTGYHYCMHLDYLGWHSRPLFRTFYFIFGKTSRKVLGMWLVARAQCSAYCLCTLRHHFTYKIVPIPEWRPHPVVCETYLMAHSHCLLWPCFVPYFITSVLLDYKGARCFRECKGDWGLPTAVPSSCGRGEGGIPQVYK